MKNIDPKPPKGFTKEAVEWWLAIRKEYNICDPGGLLILASACEAFDRMRQAQRKLKRDRPIGERLAYGAACAPLDPRKRSTGRVNTE